MTPEEFRRHGYAVIDWLVEYQQTVEQYPVLAAVEPGELREYLAAELPQRGEPFEAIFDDFKSLIPRGLTHWQSPNFFGFFPANNSAPSILGELLSAGLGVQGMMWLTSPAATELETHVLDWVVELLGLPQKFCSESEGGGVIQDSASSATLCALLTARERATRFASKAGGNDDRLVAYASSETHSSIDKAVAIAGLGLDRLRKIPVGDDFAMDPRALAAAIADDRAAGLIPFFVCATIGTTSSLAVDPVAEIGEICERERLWLHVDAAMAGTAAVCPEHRGLHHGLEYADSYCFNPHKWMFTNFDCDCFFVADRHELIATLSVLPAYLQNRASDSGSVIDYRDWQIPLGRRFRSLKLWFVLRHYGVEGLQHHIRQHIEWTTELAAAIAADAAFELATPRRLNLVCFRHRGGDELNRAVLETVNRSGELFITHTVLNDEYTLRFCVGQTHTSREHVFTAWEKIRSAAARIEQQGVS